MSKSLVAAGEAGTGGARLLSREQAAEYLGGVSVDTIDRLINTGAISIVRLPVERHVKTGAGIAGVNRRILIDRAELDAVIPQWREKRQDAAGPTALPTRRRAG